MGKEKTTVVQSGTQTATPTEEERRLQQLQLGQAEAADPLQREVQALGLENISTIFQGLPLPGNLARLSAGIDPALTEEIAQKSVADVLPQLQAGGVPLDSGVAASVGARVAGDVRRGSAEFNIGVLQNLLNLALSGQAQVQQPILATTAQLGAGLAGLRTINTTGSQTTTSMNPFLRSFQTSLGSTLGSPKLTIPFSGGGSFGF